MTSCKHEHIVPVSRPPLHDDTEPDVTTWRCLDCPLSGRIEKLRPDE